MKITPELSASIACHLSGEGSAPGIRFSRKNLIISKDRLCAKAIVRTVGVLHQDNDLHQASNAFSASRCLGEVTMDTGHLALSETA